MRRFVRLAGYVLGSVALIFTLLYGGMYVCFKIKRCFGQKEVMHVAFGINNTYAEPLNVLLTSLLWNNQDMQVHVYVLSDSLSEANKHKLSQTVSVFPDMKITFLKTFVPKEFAEISGVNGHISKETFLRFNIPLILPETVDRVLYLDADLIVDGSLQELWHTPLEDMLVAGSADFFEEEFIRYYRDYSLKQYINAGVLLMNLKEIRKTNAVSFLYRFLQNNLKNEKIQFLLPDQDTLNIVWNDKIKIFDLKYNSDMNLYHFSDAVVLHFAGPKKPWKMKLQQNYYYDIYREMNRHIVFSRYGFSLAVWEFIKLKSFEIFSDIKYLISQSDR